MSEVANYLLGLGDIGHIFSVYIETSGDGETKVNILILRNVWRHKIGLCT